MGRGLGLQTPGEASYFTPWTAADWLERGPLTEPLVQRATARSQHTSHHRDPSHLNQILPNPILNANTFFKPDIPEFPEVILGKLESILSSPLCLGKRDKCATAGRGLHPIGVMSDIR